MGLPVHSCIRTCLSQSSAHECCERNSWLHRIRSSHMCLVSISAVILCCFARRSHKVPFPRSSALIHCDAQSSRRNAAACAGYPRRPLPFPNYSTRLFPSLPWNAASLSIGCWEQERESNMGLAGVLRTEEWFGFDIRAKLMTGPDWCPVRLPWHACSSLWEILGAVPLLVLSVTWVAELAKCRQVLMLGPAL
jgi:hypothetical protein